MYTAINGMQLIEVFNVVLPVFIDHFRASVDCCHNIILISGDTFSIYLDLLSIIHKPLITLLNTYVNSVSLMGRVLILSFVFNEAAVLRFFINAKP